MWIINKFENLFCIVYKPIYIILKIYINSCTLSNLKKNTHLIPLLYNYIEKLIIKIYSHHEFNN